MYHTTLILIIDQNEQKILLGRHTRGIGVGKINAPGWKLDPGETFRQSACREVLEETGLIVQPDELQKKGYLRFLYPKKPEKDHDCYIYVANAWQGSVRENDEMELAWYPLDRIPFDQMWESDDTWLPQIIETSHPLTFDVFFHPDDSLISLSNSTKISGNIMLTRHAWAQHNELGIYDSIGNYRLTEKGKKDARAITKKFNPKHTDHIYSSPLARCIETVTPLSEQTNLSIHTDDRIREIHFGDGDGWPYVPENKQKRLDDLSFRPDGWESFWEVIDRCDRFIQEIQSQHPGENIVVCTHGNPGRAFHYLLSGKDPRYLQTDFEFRQAQPKVFGF